MFSSSGAPTWLKIFFFGLVIALGVVFLFLACVLGTNWFPFLILVPLSLLVLPVWGLTKVGSIEDPGHGNLDGIAYVHWPSVMLFLVGALVVCSLALPAVLGHVQVITVGAMAFTLAGTIVLYVSVTGYVWMNGQSSMGF